jgi:hypothetical protein
VQHLRETEPPYLFFGVPKFKEHLQFLNKTSESMIGTSWFHSPRGTFLEFRELWGQQKSWLLQESYRNICIQLNISFRQNWLISDPQTIMTAAIHVIIAPIGNPCFSSSALPEFSVAPSVSMLTAGFT